MSSLLWISNMFMYQVKVDRLYCTITSSTSDEFTSSAYDDVTKHHIKTCDGNRGAWKIKFAVLHFYTHDTRRQSHENPPGIGMRVRNIFSFTWHCFPVDPTYSKGQNRHQRWPTVWITKRCHERECHRADEACYNMTHISQIRDRGTTNGESEIC